MAKLFKVLFGVLLTLIILVLVGGYIFLKTFDLNKYKPYVTELASKELGRKVAINGESSLGISLMPTIILRDVEVANAEWAQEPQMLKVGELEVKLSLMPLLKKQIVIDKVALLNTQIFLSVAADGRENWMLQLPSKDEAKAIADQTTTANVQKADTPAKAKESKEVNSAAAALAGFAAKNVSIENAVIKYDNQKTKQVMDVNIKSVNLSAESMDSNITADFDVVFNQQNIKGDMTLGSINSILQKKDAVPVILNVNAYGVDLSVNGSVQDIMTEPGYKANVNVYNPAGNFGAPETTLQAVVTGNTKKVSADISMLNVVNNVITGNVFADIAGKVPYVEAKLKSDKINLMNFQQTNNLASLLPELISSAQASDLVPNETIPFNVLKEVNAKTDITIGSLIINNEMQADNILMKAVLQNGILNVNPLQLNFGGGVINGSLMANAANDSVAIKLLSNNMQLQKIHKEFVVQNDKDFGVLSGGNVDLDINLTGSGTTYRQLVNSLKGEVITIVGETVIQTGKLDFVMGNFVTQLLNALNLSNNSPRNIDLVCGVIRSNLGDGKAVFPKGIAVNSKQLNVVSDGSINLVNDKIDFGIRPFSGKVVDTNIAQALSSFIKVKGTLTNPKIAIDDAQAVKAIIGVAATGGTAYLGSKLVLDADSSPCYTALQGTSYQSRFPAPSKAQQAGQDLYQGTEKAIDNSIKDIKSSAKDIINIFKGAVKNK